MTIFGKPLSEYVNFQKVILGLILVVGLTRLALSLAGVSNSMTKWLSISVVTLIGLVYYSIRVHTTGFGSYKQLLPLHVIQNFVANLIIAAGIVIAIFTGQDNIFSAPEYSGGGDGKNWLHVAAHMVLGVGVGSLLGWLVGCVILWVVKKAAPKGKATAAGM